MHKKSVAEGKSVASEFYVRTSWKNCWSAFWEWSRNF